MSKDMLAREDRADGRPSYGACGRGMLRGLAGLGQEPQSRDHQPGIRFPGSHTEEALGSRKAPRGTRSASYLSRRRTSPARAPSHSTLPAPPPAPGSLPAPAWPLLPLTSHSCSTKGVVPCLPLPSSSEGTKPAIRSPLGPHPTCKDSIKLPAHFIRSLLIASTIP